MRFVLLLLILSYSSVSAVFAEWPGTGNAELDSLLRHAKGKPMSVGLPMYAKALKLKPNCSITFNERAMLYENAGVLDKALADCDKALQLDAKDAFSHLIKARIYFLSNRHLEARNEAEKAGQLEIDAAQLDNDALRVEGASNYYLKNYNQAVELLTSGLQNVPVTSHGSADAYYFRGLSYLKLGEGSKALADFNEALKIYPKYSQYYLSRALAHKMLGQDQLAKSDLQTASKLPQEKHMLFY